VFVNRWLVNKVQSSLLGRHSLSLSRVAQVQEDKSWTLKNFFGHTYVQLSQAESHTVIASHVRLRGVFMIPHHLESLGLPRPTVWMTNYRHHERPT
jgi:hypothetical protein